MAHSVPRTIQNVSGEIDSLLAAAIRIEVILRAPAMNLGLA
jgi:hypothetical protein